MPVITLPDGSQKQFASAVTVAEVAQSIGPGLARAALAGKIDGRLVDTSHTISDDARLAIVTDKDPEGLEVIRHSTAHLMAYAVKELFPEAQVTIGPVVDNGFYYDFSYERPFTPDDLAAIEARMLDLARRDLPVRREEWARDEATAFFKSIGEHYKAELIDAIPPGEVVSLYREGDFVDLCRGPHVPSTGRIRVFKLMKVAGAYWRGDHRNEQLQRIYGTAWAKKEDQDAYLHMLEEAEKRDHRKLGRQLDLYHLQDEAPGMVFWHPKGWTIWQEVEQYLRRVLRANGYREVKTPMIMDRSLWERSGHWQNYAENMFTTASENRDYAIKPMNCPGHIQIYNQGLRSYRDLPMRLAEFGSCHRNEPSGALHGIMRVRAFVQDDAHIFCTEAQVLPETAAFIDLLQQIYADFGFSEILVKLSTRPAKRIGSDEVWDRAEAALAEALAAKGLIYDLQPGEGAFYGPKIEFSLKDCLGRVWQCGTLQLDFALPERLDAHYIAETNERQIPVMLHRAILGSLERFIGILVEHYAGAMPLWLSPVHAVVLNISEKQIGYAGEVAATLCAAGLRVEADLRNEKITYKIREHSLNKLPYQIVVGDKEMAANQVAVRSRGGRDLGQMPVEALCQRLLDEIAARSGTA
ncbi:threonine--tRNA ligase [Accumulibacter sp.]|uniref:threonine--tRNA ligase n=1 Tax=Accumulibacter sp. TaxID=2053492 RepID=UPI0025E2BED4|nr:threonine--tRNA ligase [Accumulibacter sp.]MCM8594856.1 threonine--tRNA ligase [Accumulibacter sp.]MCM8626014.1 threonine--tRNA ligase [Accumulibacter sp.]MDS4049002.1 threonine--tRNA ligase [Accumulibacter sp.]